MTHRQVSNLFNRQMKQANPKLIGMILSNTRHNFAFSKKLLFESNSETKAQVMTHFADEAKKGNIQAKKFLVSLASSAHSLGPDIRQLAWVKLWEVACAEKKTSNYRLIRNAFISSITNSMDYEARKKLLETVSKRIRGGDKKMLLLVTDGFKGDGFTQYTSGERFALAEVLSLAAEEGSKEAAFTLFTLVDEKDPNLSMCMYKAISDLAKKGMRETLPVLIQGVNRVSNNDNQIIFIKEGLEAFARQKNKAAQNALRKIEERGPIVLDF